VRREYPRTRLLRRSRCPRASPPSARRQVTQGRPRATRVAAGAVQPSVAGCAGARTPFAAAHPGDGESGPGCARCRLRGTALQQGAPIDAHGVPAAGQAPADSRTRCAPSAYWWSRSATSGHSAGLSNCRWKPRSAITRFFTKNRDRLLEAEIAWRFLREVVDQARGAKHCPGTTFRLDGARIQVWATMEPFRPWGGSGSIPGPGRNSERHCHRENG